MKIMEMDYFIADYLDSLLEREHDQDDCDKKGYSYAKQIHELINSEFWEDEWMCD